ncbi:pyridoxal phosphate-dependent aminotransferase [Megalodesulfovibrio paquesii]
MRLAERLQVVKPSATLAVSAKAMALKAQGKKIISLSVGEPDFNTPAHVREAAKAAIDQNFTRYTQVAGIPELRAAVGAYYKKFYDVEVPGKQVVVTNGGKQALFNYFQCVLDPGDEVLIPAPYWVSYPDMVALAGGVPVIVDTLAEHDYKINPADIMRHTGPRTRCLVLNSPSNPTGATYTQAELDLLVETCIEKGILIISDEIYDQLVFSPYKPASCAKWFSSHPELISITNGLAKSFAMTGWRMGWLVAHPDIIEAMDMVQSQSTSNVCSIVQKAALAALTGPWDEVEAMRAAFEQRRNMVMDIISSWKGVVCPIPAGAFYAFPDVSKYYDGRSPDSVSLCNRLMEEAGVALVPGEAFGAPRCVRISYALDEATLRTALDAVARGLGAA